MVKKRSRSGDADDGDPAVQCPEHAVDARDHRVPPVGRTRDLARHEVAGVLARLGPDLTAEERGLDELAPPAAFAESAARIPARRTRWNCFAIAL